MNAPDLRGDAGYTPYQEAFLTQFVAEVGPGSLHLLLAPVGTGKSFAMAGTISELVRTDRLRRVLVLAPAALAAQWAYLLDRRGQEAAVVDARVLRILRQQVGGTSPDWPEGVYAMSIDLAKRSDVSEVLLATPWDLVVVDEAHALAGQRFRLIEDIAQTEHAPALLMATHLEDGGTQRFASRATVIDWRGSVAEFLALREKSAAPPLVRETRTFRRTDNEAAVARQVVACARELGPLKGMVLLQRASSSISCLEESLIRWVEAPDQAEDLSDLLEGLLEVAEELRTDTRLECFRGLVEELVAGGVRHAVAFCEYRATLDYLAATVERLDFPDFGLHGGMGDEQRKQILSSFEANGGLLITTAAASEGASLSFVEAAIHYDLPPSPAAFAQREGRYHRYGRRLPCTVYFLEDETGSLPLEDLLLRMARKADLVTGEMGVDVAGIFRAVTK